VTEEDKRKIEISVYVCGVDWQHELGESGDCVLRESLESLKLHHNCWEADGIVKLKCTLEFEDWVHPQDFSKLGKKEKIKILRTWSPTKNNWDTEALLDLMAFTARYQHFFVGSQLHSQIVKIEGEEVLVLYRGPESEEKDVVAAILKRANK
jgi:hypothetical protein